MRVLLFRLNGVGEEEADEVRALLTDHGIEFYETEAGRWRISVAAIWLRDDHRLEEARRLIGEYQQARSRRVRGEYRQALREGRAEGLLDRIRERPLEVLFALLAVVLILYFSITPFVGLIRHAPSP
ncbi:DUF6164 family protein [Endothiovibrio diazotrophicus]